jgi:hypothetical protein
MQRFNFSLIGLTIISLVCWTSCTYNTLETPPFNVTQEQLDAATILPTSQDTAITGDPFNGFPNDTITANHKLRDLFASIPINKNITVGTIMVRRAYYYPWGEDKRDSLINIVVMVKREKDFYPEGGDWEYIDIKYNKNTNYALNPNGILPDVTNLALRGKIEKCASCHAGGNSNFLFHRNK